MDWKQYTGTFPVLTRDVDYMGTLRPASMLEMCQEVATIHSTGMGLSRETLLKNHGVVWVLTSLETHLDCLPVLGDEITITTQHMPTRHFFFPRYYTLTDARTGQPFGTIASLWVLMDIQTRRMQAPGEIARMMPDNSDLVAPAPLPAPVSILSDAPQASEYHPLVTDLDLNRHVNNARYLDWCLNALGMETLTDFEISNFIANYRHEVLPDEPVTIELRRHDQQFSFSVMHHDTRCFDLSGSFRPRSQQAKA